MNRRRLGRGIRRDFEERLIRAIPEGAPRRSPSLDRHPRVHLFDAPGQRLELIGVVTENVGHPVPQTRRKKLAPLAHQAARLRGAATNARGRPPRTRFQAFLADVAAAGVTVAKADADGDEFTRPAAQTAEILADVVLAANHEF